MIMKEIASPLTFTVDQFGPMLTEIPGGVGIIIIMFSTIAYTLMSMSLTIVPFVVKKSPPGFSICTPCTWH